MQTDPQDVAPDAGEREVVDINMAELLGANASSTQCFKIYLPNKDRDGNELNPDEIRTWIDLALDTFMTVNGGATAIKNLHGVWIDDERPDIRLIGETTLVYSFIKDPQTFLDRFDVLLAFIKRYGRKTKQKVALIEFDDAAYWVEDFSV